MAKKEKNSIQIGVHLIDKLLFAELDFSEIIETIIDKYNNNANEDEKFKEQSNNISSQDLKVKVFYSEKVRPPKWRAFLKNILDKESQLLKAVNKDASYITFIEAGDSLFAISGGQGNFIVQDYIDQNFGIDIISRLISKDEKVIKSLQDRGVTGSILGSTKFFRGDYKLSDEEEFGKIYKLIKADLDKKVLVDTFEFSEDETKRGAGCLAKSSFQINKSIDFDTLVKILRKLNDILKQEELFTLNKVSLISHRGDANKKLINDLKAKLNEELFSHCNSDSDIDFDFCHPEFDKYLIAKSYKIFRGSSKTPILETDDRIDNLVDLLRTLKSSNELPLADLVEFQRALDVLTVVSFDEDGNKQTSKSIMGHIHGEIKFNNKTYFYIDNEWYEIRDNFIEELNTDCKYSITQSLDKDILPNEFNALHSENDYAKTYLNQDGFIVLDKVLHENIETCDILKFDNEKTYLIHIKKGFDNSVRELTSQILIAARRIAQDKKSDLNFIKNVERLVKDGITVGGKDYSAIIKSQTIPINGLSSLISSRKDSDIIFCLAILDTYKSEQDLANDIAKYKSNIAKFSTLEIEKSLRSLGFGFAIAHVKKQTAPNNEA